MATQKVPKRGKKKKPTIIDVAREARVGIMTVSRVINNYPTVRPGTKEKVLAAIARTGYRPNEAAQMLKGQRGRMIAFIVPDLSDYFASCFHAVQDVAIRFGYQTLVIATGKSAEIEARQIESIAGRVAGLLIVTSGENSRVSRLLEESDLPVIALDRPYGSVKTDTVLVENREGATIGVQHLIERHRHRKIVCMGFDFDVFTVQERLKGYKAAMRAAGLKPDVLPSMPSIEAIAGYLREIAALKDRPTAVFTLQRITSIHLLQAVHRSRLKVPGDLALVGFDDLELAEVLSAPLTAVSQPATEIARCAAERLFAKIQSSGHPADEPPQPAKIVFPTNLVIRASCGCKWPPR